MKEQIPIVNEKDEIIGYKDRALIDKEIYRVSALWIYNSKEEFLLAHRGYNKKNNPGKWGPAVAGTVEKGETYEKNIIKEAEEELGLVGFKFEKGPKLLKKGKYNHFTQWYFLKLDKPEKEFDFQHEEIAEIKWFSKNEFEKEIKEHPKEFIENIKEYVKRFEDLDY